SSHSAASSTDSSTTKGHRRSKKGRGSHEDIGSSDAHKTEEPVPAPADPAPMPPVESAPQPASSSTDQIPMGLTPQRTPVVDEAPPTKAASPEPPIQLPTRVLHRETPVKAPTRPVSPEAPAQKDAAVVPPTEERKPDDVFLVSAVACAVIIAGLALAVVGIILGMSLPPAEHSCPQPDKPLAEGNVMIETEGGRLVGSTAVVEGVTLARFLGIPFAQSTAGDRRFAAPLPLPAPGDKCAVREHLEPGPPCAQWYNGSVLGSEDCLHVNVWTPAAAIGDNDHGGGRALVVAVSGKWFESGSNDDPNWPMLAAKGDVVVVAPNHRQGVLGFLHPSSVAGVDKDAAVHDVLSAVQWARDHAKAFGADPKQLVFVGRGSGAYLLSAVVRNMSSDSVQRAFYHGIVYGSLLPFDPVATYRNLAVGLNCNGTDNAMSALVACFRAAPVGELLQAAQASPILPLQFAPHIDIGTLTSPAVAVPPTVVAGADEADDKAFFDERILKLAQSNLKRRFKADSVDLVVRGFSMAVSTCATRKVAKAVAEGYHYRFHSAVATGQLMPPLGIGQVALFAAHGTVPPLADNTPWPPLGKLNETRVIYADGHENFTSYAAACAL
ncbi:hypothetical protein MTO96_042553, partial [Rhipicephalus appendiculatus]